MLYDAGRIFFKIIFSIMGVKVKGLENMPKKGAVIVAANHTSNWDPVLICMALTRPVCFMGKIELFNTPFKKKLMESLHVFPVERGKGDIHAIKVALEKLSEQEMMGIFPEGTRNKERDLSHVGGGLGLLACKSGAQVLPIALIGSDHPCGWFHPFEIRIGQAETFTLAEGEKKNSEKFTQFSQNIMQKIYSML